MPHSWVDVLLFALKCTIWTLVALAGVSFLFVIH